MPCAKHHLCPPRAKCKGCSSSDTTARTRDCNDLSVDRLTYALWSAEVQSLILSPRETGWMRPLQREGRQRPRPSPSKRIRSSRQQSGRSYELPSHITAGVKSGNRCTASRRHSAHGASVTRVRHLPHLGHLRSKVALRRSVFRRALREMPTEGGGKMRCASESAG
jgi:hypothetical protein